MVAEAGASEIVFNTDSPRLASFVQRAFEFEPAGNDDFRLLLRGFDE
jgi:hypothetical protein